MKLSLSKATGNDGEGTHQKQQWGGHIEFILTCVGYSVGLGNVWRFPYLTYQNGGGAFLIPYLIMLVLLGFPLYCLEMAFGQFTSQGPFSAWSVNPLLKGVGVAASIVCAYITTYFNVIISWSMYFFISSFAKTLPWTSCENSWNTASCVENNENLTHKNYTTPSEEFFYNNVLDVSDDIGHLGSVKWQLCILLLVAWIICFVVLIKGIQSLGKAAYVTSTFPYFLLLCVLVRGATLPGAGEGVAYYITPQWDKLKNLKVWGNAASQIFYSTGCGQSALIAMASYNKFHNNVFSDSILIPTIESMTSLYAGFVIFTLLGYMAHAKGVSVGEVAAQGPGLVFVVYPEGLSTMPIPQLWSALFFLMMLMIGFSSQFSQCEAIISAFLDEFPDQLRVGRRPMFVRLFYCIFSFLIGLPMITQGGFFVFELLDTYGAGYTLLIVAFGEIVGLNWIYGFNKWAEDIALMVGKRPNIYFRLTWCALSPIVIIAVFIFLASQEDGLRFRGEQYPSHMMALGWLIVAFPCLVIIGNFLYQYCRKGGWQVLKEASQPLPHWGPHLPENRTGKYAPPDLTSKVQWRPEEDIELATQNNWATKNGPEKHTDVDAAAKQPLYSSVDNV